MPVYRLAFVERRPAGASRSPVGRLYGRSAGGEIGGEAGETEWVESITADDPEAALVAFFRGRVGAGDIGLVEPGIPALPVDLAFDRLDPERTYIWVEDGRLMEYRGIDLERAGMTICPLCEGAGEVLEATADEYLEAWATVEE